MSKRRFVDPFFPNRPVKDPSKFEGREDQVDEIIDSLYQTLNNNPKHTIITGDRGIGKSSLLYQTEILARGNNSLADRFKLDLGVDKFDFITAWVDVDKDSSLESIITSLLKDLENKGKQLLDGLKFELDIAGTLKVSKNESGKKSISELSIQFCNRIKTAHKSAIKNGKSGILLFMDELDRISTDTGIASFLKLTCEKLNHDGINNVAFICAGITGSIQRLESEHASILRTFRDVVIPRLNLEETTSILKTGFNDCGFTYDASIFPKAFQLSAGFPEPVHLLGSEMLSVATNNNLSIQSFESAKIKLVKDVRKNELSDLLTKAGYGKYQKILECMANCESNNVSVDYISNSLGWLQNQFSTNIGTLIDREIITRVDKGVYCFVNPLLKEYIKCFGIIDSQKESDNEA